MEAMAGHKVSDTATGCVGTVSWKLGDWDKMLVVMYSVPYSHDFHSNWLAVGIFNIEDTTDYYEMMYYKTENGFRRKKFYRNGDPVEYTGDEQFSVQGTMGSQHKPEIRISLAPKSTSNMASGIKAMF